MCDIKNNNSLDDLFDDAERGICSNDIQNSNVGLTSLTEGLTTLTHGLSKSTFTYETNEKHDKNN